MTNAYWKNKTVIVTGGMGFIGSHFVEELLLLEANVICLFRTLREEVLQELNDLSSSKNLRLIQIDLLDYSELQAVFKYAAPQIDALIHCAGMDGNTEFKINNVAKIFDTNMRITSNVLNCCRTNNITDIVLLSSAEIYSPQAEAPIHEEDDYRKYPGYTENGYVLAKTFCEVLAELHRKQFGMNIYLPRPTNVYGPRDNFGDTTSRVIPSMIKKISRDEDIEIWGDGSQTRSFIYVKDLVYATLQIVQAKKHHVVNIATKESVSILQLANLLSAAFEKPEVVKLDRTKPTGVKGRDLAVNKLYTTIVFEPLDIRHGIQATVDWYTKTRNNFLRKAEQS